MGYSRLEYVYSGGAQDFAVNFALGFNDRADVTVYVKDEVDGFGDQIYRAFTWPTDGTVRVTASLTEGDTVIVERTADKDTLEIDVENTGAITRATLARSFRQLMYNIHELLDGRAEQFSGGALTFVEDAIGDAAALRDQAEVAKDDAEDAATDAAASAAAALASEGAAASSASGASASEIAAEAARDAAIAAAATAEKGDQGPPGADGQDGQDGADAPTDHGLLTGLEDDDHPQYAQKADLLASISTASFTVDSGYTDTLDFDIGSNGNANVVFTGGQLRVSNGGTLRYRFEDDGALTEDESIVTRTAGDSRYLMAPAVFQAWKSSGAAIPEGTADITGWNTPVHEDTGFSFNATTGELTIGADLDGKRIMFSAQAGVDQPSRTEVLVILQSDTGSGYSEVYRAGGYTTRNIELDTGWATLGPVVVTVSTGDKFKVRLAVNTEGLDDSTEKLQFFQAITVN